MKKKIIALTSVIVALLLIAGIGLAVWAFTNGGNASTEQGNNGGTTGVETNTTLGTLTVKTGSTYGIVFDQNSITYQNSVTYDDETGYVTNTDLNATGLNFTLEWNLGSDYSGDKTPSIAADGDVKFYVTIYIYSKTGANSDDLTPYIETRLDSDSVITDRVTGSATAVTDKENYTGTKYELTVSTSQNDGTGVWSTGSWDSNKIELGVNLNNFLKYKTDAIEDEEALDEFNGHLYMLRESTNKAIIVKFEAVYTPAV